MAEKTNKFDFSSEEAKLAMLNKIVAYFQDERNEQIGLVAAENILNFFLENLGDVIYQKAIIDTKKLLNENIENINIELDLLSEK